jgi:hypothetical protein
MKPYGDRRQTIAYRSFELKGKENGVTKEDARQLLIDKGMNAVIVDGVVEVVSADYKDADRMGKILKKAGYKDSYGWRMSHDVVKE